MAASRAPLGKAPAAGGDAPGKALADAVGDHDTIQRRLRGKDLEPLVQRRVRDRGENRVRTRIPAGARRAHQRTATGAEIVEDAKEFVLYSWSVQSAINPVAVAGAEGRYFWDYDGKRYLDFALASGLFGPYGIAHRRVELWIKMGEGPEDFAKAHGLKPLGRLVAWAVVGVEPKYMGIGPAPAGRRPLREVVPPADAVAAVGGDRLGVALGVE